MKKILSCLLLLGLVGCASVPRPDSVDTPPAPPPYEAWSRVLQQFVDEQGRVNFAALAKSRADLDRMVAYVYDIGPNNQPALFPTKQHVLAYHINAYNALAMHKVIATGIPVTLAGIKKVGFFALGKVQVGGEAISLYEYENKVIRPLGDPRIHFALNCMSVGCPRLPREVFLPATLDAQLERESRLFFAEDRNVRLEVANKTVTLSEIIKFFTVDFLASEPTLIGYVNRYRTIKIPADYKVEFSNYDWTINHQPAK